MVGRTRPSGSATLSSVRNTVVPTATMRPPAARAALMRAAVCRRHRVPFGVHAVRAGVGDLDRQEGAGADVQGDESMVDAALGQAPPSAAG